MKILLSKLPVSGWWHKGIPKYADNPAMQEGEVPNLGQLEKERRDLISVIQNAGHEVVEYEFPNELDGDNPKHDFIFIRDPFISNQKGTAIILRAGEPLRRMENKIMKPVLESLGMKIIQVPDKTDMYADGGEFYYCAKDNILFSGLRRNTRSGVDFVADALNVDEVVIIRGNGYHLDTFFTPALSSDGIVSALIICTSVLSKHSKKALYQFADEKNIPVFDIPPDDGIGTSERIGSFSVNALPLPGLLIRPNHFSKRSIDDQLLDLGIQQIITPTSQFQLSGGSIHCITNEI